MVCLLAVGYAFASTVLANMKGFVDALRHPLATTRKMWWVPWTREEEDACMARLAVVQEDLARQGRPGSGGRGFCRRRRAATCAHERRRAPLVVDGPFAETKEQLLGFYLIECQDLDESDRGSRASWRSPTPGGTHEVAAGGGPSIRP